jgi:tetratricopeptide (TPR) repeat protein
LIPPNTENPERSRVLAIAVCCFLAAITWLVFGQTLHHGFVNYDDDMYVYKNLHVIHGLTITGVAWAFRSFYASNWHPLTWISHMVDVQLWGLNAGGHHFTNLLFHTLNVLLLFLVLRQATGRIWRSAFVAAVFAIHPLHVESVAWVAERKDVLSGVFFFITIGVYVWYARRSSLWRYFAVILFLALGLMCKPVLVTTPFVLLVLDYWPLRRFAGLTPPDGSGAPRTARDWRFLCLEKIPLLALSAASCLVTVLAQRTTLASADKLPFLFRVNNALVSYVAYIWQMIWPVRLAAFYPHPENHLRFWEVALAVLLLVLITVLAIVLRKKRPYVITGWLWYVGMLVPAIGLVQVGLQARADRYTYLPQIGLYLMVTWAAADVLALWRYGNRILAPAAAVLIGVLAWRASVQTSYWRNSQTLWTHALAVTSNNAVAHLQLGNFFLDRNEVDAAIHQYRTALAIRPVYGGAENNLGVALEKKGRIIEAAAHFEKAINLGTLFLRQRPAEEAIAYYNVGIALAKEGKQDAAILYYQRALRDNPAYAEAYYAMGNSLLAERRFSEAIAQYEQALKFRKRYAEVQSNMAIAFLQQGNVPEAIRHWERTLEIQPDFAQALNNLAWLLATFPETSVRDGARAVKLAQRACRLSGDRDPSTLRTLAASYAETARFAEATATAERASALARSQGNTELAEILDSDVAHYQKNEPLRMAR